MTTAAHAMDRFDVGAYSPRVAAMIARIKYQSFQAWAKANLLHAVQIPIGKRKESIYTYHDLLLIRLIMRLKQQGAKAKHIKIALHTLEVISGGDKDAWMQAVLFVDIPSGVVVAYLSDKPEWNPLAASKGTQKMATIFFPALIKELKDELVPIEKFPYIEIDPQILGGAPVVKGTRISVRAVVSVKESGQDATKVYPDSTEAQVANAEAYQEFLRTL